MNSKSLFLIFFLSGISFLIEGQSLTLDYKKKDLTPSTNFGKIDLIVDGAMNPTTVLWSDGNTNFNRDQLSEGTYNATVTDAGANTAIASVEIANLVLWKDITDIELRDKLIKKILPDSWTNTGMSSRNKLSGSGSGHFRIKVGALIHTFAVGLAESNSDLSYNHIDYCFKVENDQLSILENGVLNLGGNTLTEGDILSIEKDASNNVVNYLKNGVQLASTAISTGNSELIVDYSHFSETVGSDYLDWDFYTSFGFETISNSHQEYVELTRKIGDEFYHVVNGALKFKLNQSYDLPSSSTLECTFYDISSAVPASIGSLNPSVVYGTNWYDLDLSSPGITFSSGKYYMLEVSTNKEEKYYLRFKYN